MRLQHWRPVLIGLLSLCMVFPGVAGWQTAGAQEATPVVDLNTTMPAQPGGTLPGDPQLQLIKMAGGLADPVNIAAPDDGSGRLFIVERVGRIRVLEPGGTLLEEPFLDLTELVQNDYLEQGLLGLAFHPDYANNGRFYVNFTDYHTNGDTFVMESVVSEDDPNVANREGGRLLLAIDQPYDNHNGGPSNSGRMAISTSAQAMVAWAAILTIHRRTSLRCLARSCVSTSIPRVGWRTAFQPAVRTPRRASCSQTASPTSSARRKG
jgi:hypothetical protein